MRRKLKRTAAVIGLLVLAGALGSTGIFRADQLLALGKTIVVRAKIIDGRILTVRLDGSTGPTLTLNGVLHLLSQALDSQDGTLVGFRLQTNLSDAFAASADGTDTYVAVGASDGIPADCGPEPCLPSFWTLTFRLVPQGGPGGQPSLLFSLIVNTVYAADGSLVSACVVGQDGCGVIP